jgi:hypothetical protein
MKIRHLWRWPALWLALVGATIVVPAGAAEHAGHQHEAGAHALKLNAGKKWTTDEPLRRGMEAIRRAIAADREAIHANTESAAQYKALAGKLDEQIAYIVGNCKLEPEADANLHVILADIIAGSDAMKAKDKRKRRSGALKVDASLKAYPEYFEHPGW